MNPGLRDNPEYRYHWGAILQLRRNDEEYQRRICEANRRASNTPHERLRRRVQGIRLWQDPAYVQKQKDARQEYRRIKNVIEMLERHTL